MASSSAALSRLTPIASCDTLFIDESLCERVDLSPDDGTRIFSYTPQLTRRLPRSMLLRRRTVDLPSLPIMTTPPFTPMRQDPPRQAFEDSPFSDYFSEVAESPRKPSQREFVQRLDKIGAHLARDDYSDQLFANVNANLAALEDALAVPHTPAFPRGRMVDSGLFMDDEAEGQLQDGLDYTPLALSRSPIKGVAIAPTFAPIFTPNGLLRQAQDLLARAIKSNGELRLRTKELKTARDNQLQAKEEALQQCLHLRSQNDELHASLSFVHSDMLLLSLHMKGLQLQALPYLERTPDCDNLMDGMEKWKDSWQEAHARLKARLQTHQRNASALGHGKDNDVQMDQILSAGESEEYSNTEIETLLALEHDSSPLRIRHPDRTSAIKRAVSCLPDIKLSKRVVLMKSGEVMEELSEDKTNRLTPWQELWRGLSALAGAGDDGVEDF